MTCTIRLIQEKDDPVIETIIRQCLIEYGGNHEGTAWDDPDLGRFSKIYNKPGQAYWVAEDEKGIVVGGVGIGPLKTDKRTCELQKMYCVPAIRSKGVASKLLDTALSYARTYYDQCYLETLDTMVEAQRFYEKHGFNRISYAMGNTSHFSCDVRYLIQL